MIVNRLPTAAAYCRFFWVEDGARTHDPQNHNLML